MLPDAIVERFNALLAAARSAGEPEPTAVSLATADAGGRPSVRIVLLKQLDDRGFVFYTNTDSIKGRQLAVNPQAAICAHWKHLDFQVQVRGEGHVQPVSADEADRYFAGRPRGSQIGAWASLQSQPLDRRETLERRIAQFERRFADVPVPRPPHWSGYRLQPDRVEFWFGREHRLHERDVFVFDQGEWRQQSLYP